MTEAFSCYLSYSERSMLVAQVCRRVWECKSGILAFQEYLDRSLPTRKA